MESTSAPQTIYLENYQPPTYWIDDIALNVELNEEETHVQSTMHVRRNCHSIIESHDLVLHGDELILESIKLNGEVLTHTAYQVTDTSLTIYNVPDQFDLTITTIIFPQKNTALSGLYRSRDTYCTQCEAEGFRRITYFLDRPDVLARFTTTISADKVRYPYLLSNGNLIETGSLPDNRHFAKWEDPFKKPSYLFALVAGDFDLLEDHFITATGARVLLRIYVEKGFGDQSHHAMYSLKQAMRWDEQTYGREYDLNIYMIVAIGDFNMGAMENKGLNIFNTKYVLAKPETATDEDYIHILSVIGHEYFHNWTGNRITCRDWFQLSLKEGLTIFRDQSFSEDELSRAVMRIHDVNQLREVQFLEDASPLAHPVRPESYIEINNFYTATVYNKGAEVLRMLQTLLGKALFRKGMDLYFAHHDGEAVTIEDYVKTMEAVSGMNLSQFRLWYSQAGTPTVTVEDQYDALHKTYILTMTQSCPPTPHQPHKKPMLIPVKIGLLDENGHAIPLVEEDNVVQVEKVLLLTEATQRFQFTNIPSHPVPSLLRHFSAPIKLHYDYTDQNLLFLFKHDKDDFNRWEAGQQYALRIMLKLIEDKMQGKPLQLANDLLNIFEYILQQNTPDKLFTAEMLTLPSERYIAQQMEVVNVDAIHISREFVLTAIAERWQTLLLDTYQRYHERLRTYHFGLGEIGKRRLKNLCLSYLAYLPQQYAELIMQQFSASLHTNMTDTLAALVALSNIDSPLRLAALDQFYVTWKHDPLVVDKWFAIQAASKLPNTLSQVKKLLQHEAFDIKNPNKVYALIGTFGRNAAHFHAKDGEGYAFLGEIIEQLDALNPQIAARMVNPLTTWQRYDKERQALMREQLMLLSRGKKVSSDLYELVTKSLMG